MKYTLAHTMIAMTLVCLIAAVVALSLKCRQLEQKLEDNVFLTETLAKEYMQEVVDTRRRLEDLEK